MGMVILFMLGIGFTLLYLIAMRVLMVRLKTKATGYWQEIGAPDSFSANAASAMLTNLYRSKMREVLRGLGSERLLLVVRALFVLSVAINGSIVVVTIGLHS